MAGLYFDDSACIQFGSFLENAKSLSKLDISNLKITNFKNFLNIIEKLKWNSQ